MEQLSRARSFGGWAETYRHDSETCQGPMQFAVYVPPQMEKGPVPVLTFLSGLTCNEENFVTKSGVQRVAARLGFLIVAPDTSPRGAGIEGEDEDWDLGTGAGFYVNATEPKWRKHYNMYDYVNGELPALVETHFHVRPEKQGLFGHSMGGHGALVSALRNPGRFCSVSAFAPICAPSECPWGQKAFTNYLGPDTETWGLYDACRLAKEAVAAPPMLIDQGAEDPFLTEQLKPEHFEHVCEQQGLDLTLRWQEGYDHSYYFIATFLEDHMDFHAGHMGLSDGGRS